MQKLSAVYNVCGISGRESLNYYAAVINSVYQQDFDNYNVAISACRVSPEVIKVLNELFPQALIVNITDTVPISVSFNFAVQKLIEKFGPSEGYLYLDYGIILQEKNVLAELYKLFKSGPYSMVSTRTDNDSGYHLWFGVGKSYQDESENWRLFENGDFIVPIGRCVNLHAQIFSHELYEYYGNKIMPDIFAAYCMESIFSFMNGAIGRKWVVSKNVVLHHEQLPLNGASGFGSGLSGTGLDKPFAVGNIIERLRPSQEFGGGYDESRGIIVHYPHKYDENGYCKDPLLKTFIKDYYFLSESEFAYSKINYQMVG